MSGDPICGHCGRLWPCGCCTVPAPSQRCICGGPLGHPVTGLGMVLGPPRFEWRSALVDAERSFWRHPDGAPYDPARVLNDFEAEGWEVVKIIEVENRSPRLTVLMRRPQP